MDYQDKIEKLLALAESANEYEAKAALAKARELIAKQKTEKKEEKEEKEECSRVFLTENVVMQSTGISYSQDYEPWTCYLSRLVSKKYRCMSFHRKCGEKAKINFVGLPEDVDTCAYVFSYFVNLLHLSLGGFENMMKDKLNDLIIQSYFKTNDKDGCLKKICDGYACGFVSGLGKQMENQANPAIPNEVFQALLKIWQKESEAEEAFMIDASELFMAFYYGASIGDPVGEKIDLDSILNR